MLKQQAIITKLFFIILLLLANNSFAQKRVTVEVVNLPLSTIMNQVSVNYNIRFAFDEDLLSKIETSLSMNNVALEEFMKHICEQFGLRYRLIAGTYVFFVDNETKMAEAIIATVKRKNIVKPVLKVDSLIINEYTLNGVVLNRKTDERINFCKVEINGVETAITNEMGFFSKTFEGNNVINLHVKHLGYESYDTTFILTSSMATKIALKPYPLLLAMPSMGTKHISSSIELSDVPEMLAFDPTSTLEIPGIESNDLVNALIVIPGINFLKGIDTGLSIRGGAPSDNLVLIDGIPMIESSHLMGNLSVLNAKYIQQAFVSRGGFGAEYGGRTSGIVDLTGKAGSSDKTEIDFTANMLHTNIYMGVPINDKTSLSGSFKKSFADVWPNFLIENFALENKNISVENGLSEKATVKQTMVNYSDINFKVSIRPDTHSEISFNLFSSFDKQQRDYIFPGEGSFYQNNFSRSATTGFSTNYKIQSRKGWLNTFSVGFNDLKSSSESENGKIAQIASIPVKPFFDSDNIHLRELLADWKSVLNLKYISHKFGLGYNYNYLDYLYEDHEIKIPGANNFNDSISLFNQNQNLNTYYQAELIPYKWLRFRVGVRGLYNINKGLFSAQPRYGIELIPVSKLKVYYSGGRYLQHIYLTYRIDSYHNASPIWFIPTQRNQNLDAFHHIVGTRFETKKILFNLEAYQKYNHGKIFFTGEERIRDGLLIVDYTQRGGEEVNTGVDVFFQYRSTFFKHLISYSLSQSNEKIEGINNDEYFGSFDAQRHRLRLTEIATYNGWTASMNWFLATGSPYMLNTSTSSNIEFGMLNNFMQLDLSLVKQFDFKYFFADIGVTVLNVFNSQNQLSVKNFVIPEGSSVHNVQTTTTATSFSPLFFINLRYE